MRLFGFDVSRTKQALSPVPFGGGGGWRTVFDSTAQHDTPPGAFQRHEHFHDERLVSFTPVYSCVTLIANDIGKLRQYLKRVGSDNIAVEATSPAFSPVLNSPNPFQNHIQFKQWWITSKLDSGNTYVLKQRDNRNVVVALYILHPQRVTPMISPDGSVYYRLMEDWLSGLEGASVTVPASEIIHDRMNCLFHPLVGTPPLYSAALAASQGLGIQSDSFRFFANGSNPGGVLTAPAAISDETAARAKAYWDENYAGPRNAGKVAILGDGLTFQQMRMNSVDAQVAEQLKLSATFVCSAYHVPPFKVGLADIPVRQTVSDLNQIYYSDCLQSLIEEYEQCMGDGIGSSAAGYDVEIDTDGLLRMDQATLFNTLGVAVDKTIMTPNEARIRLELPPMEGGDALYKQQQEFSLKALAKRDSTADPFGAAKPAPAAPPAATPAANDPAFSDQAAKEILAHLTKGLGNG